MLVVFINTHSGNKMDYSKKELWNQLSLHAKTMRKTALLALFNNDPHRFQHFSINYENHLFDFSKNFITNDTLNLFNKIAKSCQLAEHIDMLFHGKITSMQKPIGLHTALRQQDKKITINGHNVSIDIKNELQRMKNFVEKILEGTWCGYTHKPITDVVNIGIGGSDLGPSFLAEALTTYRTHLNVHFVSNGDGVDAHHLIKKLNPETTLFIIVSKTFSTQETFINANIFIRWFINTTQHNPLAQHIIGVSANPAKMNAFGIPEKNQFHFWDFIGGRFSVWSSVGLAAALAIGFDNFNEFLIGGQSIDEHFLHADFRENIPCILAFLDIFYINYWDAQSRAILPYHTYLKKLPTYLQQLSMESLGKSVDKEANAVGYLTGNLIWGELGLNGQHSFYQLLHQGTLFIPVDFIVPLQLEHHQKALTNFILANALGQAKALLVGKGPDELVQELLTNEQIKFLPHRIASGNRPSSMILLADLTPRTIGQLFSLYEHKIFVQSVVWNINPFDQWGVELGKELAKKYMHELENISLQSHDDLINFIKKNRKITLKNNELNVANPLIQ